MCVVCVCVVDGVGCINIGVIVVGGVVVKWCGDVCVAVVVGVVIVGVVGGVDVRAVAIVGVGDGVVGCVWCCW